MKRKAYSKTLGCKGSVSLEALTVIIILFVFAISTFSVNLFLNSVNDGMQEDPDMDNLSKQIVDDHVTEFPAFWDNIFLFVFLMLWAIMLVAAYQIPSHPIFFIFAVIIMVFIFVAAIMIGNVYEELVAEEDFAGVTVNYPKTNWVMFNLLKVAIVMSFSIALVLYGKIKET